MSKNLEAELRLALEVCRDVWASAETILGQVSIKSGEHFKLLVLQTSVWVILEGHRPRPPQWK